MAVTVGAHSGGVFRTVAGRDSGPQQVRANPQRYGRVSIWSETREPRLITSQKKNFTKKREKKRHETRDLVRQPRLIWAPQDQPYEEVDCDSLVI